MTATRRVLVSTYGSAGDLFPLVPAISRLIAAGHDVRCAVPRALGLYLRALRVKTYALGDGTEMRVLSDPAIVTRRFDGWASWRRTMTHYVAASLVDDVRTLERVVETWTPDIVATMSFGVAARVAAFRRDLPFLDVSLYPQQVRQLPRSGAFALPLRAAVAELCGLDPRDDIVTGLLWGCRSPVVLHDPSMVDLRGIAEAELVGFPYWDLGPDRPGDAESALHWIERSHDTTLLVTLGSFLGARQREVWLDVLRAVGALGVRALCVGPRGHWDDDLFRRDDNLFAVGFVPLSQVVDRVDAVVHHGGIGTMFGTLRAGRPAAVLPQAFDQAHNARMVARLGVGVDASRCRIEDALASLLGDTRLADRAGIIADALIPADAAVVSLVDCIEGG